MKINRFFHNVFNHVQRVRANCYKSVLLTAVAVKDSTVGTQRQAHVQYGKAMYRAWHRAVLSGSLEIGRAHV